MPKREEEVEQDRGVARSENNESRSLRDALIQ
jgi:hypothetical protein